MTRLAKIPLYGNVAKAVTVNLDATDGAQIGVNLLMPDGTVATTAKLQALFGIGTSGSGPDTTDALDEGAFNLYFTDRRAQDAVGAILADSANVTLVYVGGTSIKADLTDLADTGTGALLAIERDGKGRITGTRAATITGTAGNITVTNGDAVAGLPTIDLADVSVTAGGTLKKRAFDAKGRLSQEAAATTDDLTEGATNLWFTAARVRSVVLTGLSLATSAVIAATDTVLGALGKLQAQITDNLLPPGYIDGLQMQWVSGTALTVTSGAAYIEGSSKVLRATSAIAKTGLSLSASTWYHVYLYDNAGTPDVEIVTTVPASPYNGTARSKTVDTSRRYVGSVRTDTSGNIIKFVHNSSGGYVNYLVDINNAQLFILSNGTSTTEVTVSAATAAPITSRLLRSFSENSGTSSNVYISNPDAGTPPTSYILAFLRASKQMFLPIALTASQTFTYSVGSGSSLTVWATGYDYER